MALKLAITGGTGFVGGHTMAAAAAHGHSIRALCRRPQPPRAGVEWVTGTLDDAAALQQLVAGADAVIHIAGVTNARTAAEFHAANVQGTAHVLAAGAGLPLVHVSSLSAREPALSVYGASKLAGEQLTAQAGGRTAIVRPPGVYGPGDTELLMVFKAVQMGVVPLPAGARASLIHGADLGAALVALAEDLAGAGQSAGGCFEIDDGHGGYAQTEIVAAMAAALGVRARVVPVPGVLLGLGAAIDTAMSKLSGRMPKLSFDRARYLAHPDWAADASALLALGLWQPRICLNEGVQATACWYRAQGLLR